MSPVRAGWRTLMSEEGVLSAVCCTLRHFVTLPRLPQRVLVLSTVLRVCLPPVPSTCPPNIG